MRGWSGIDKVCVGRMNGLMWWGGVRGVCVCVCVWGGASLWETTTSSLSVCKRRPVDSSLAESMAVWLRSTTQQKAAHELGTSRERVFFMWAFPNSATLFLLGLKGRKGEGGGEDGGEEGCRSTPYPLYKAHPQNTPLETTSTTYTVQAVLSTNTDTGLQVRANIYCVPVYYTVCVCVCVCVHFTE